MKLLRNLIIVAAVALSGFHLGVSIGTVIIDACKCDPCRCDDDCKCAGTACQCNGCTLSGKR